MHASPVADLVTTIVVLLLVSAFTLALSRRWRLPFTVLLVVVGMLLGLLADHGPEMLRPLAEHDISPDVTSRRSTSTRGWCGATSDRF
jgi:Kef-type K+ transport system membrane component KefB